ncbi:MAG: hypothetical protein O7I93_03235 [Gemmatimonadetes bacterium]|nr:hypothetical protein [Gemmatimonadota bacterium]
MISVVLFARAPRAGAVKSRPSPHSLSGTIRPDALAEMRAWLGEYRFRPQPEGDLGASIAFGFQGHFARRPDRSVLAVGADAPVLLPELRDVDRLDDLTALDLWPP